MEKKITIIASSEHKNEVQKIKGSMSEGVFMGITMPDNPDNIIFAGITSGTAVFDRMIGMDQSEMYELMTKAVNNRTRQRNYFRLYSELLEGSISEKEFYKFIEENEDDYVIDGNEKPTVEKIKKALYLASHIKDVKTSEDISNLFSFDSIETDKCLLELELHGNIH